MRFTLLTQKQNWGEDRVMYYDDNGRLCSLLSSWTNVPDPDLFTQISSGRSWFRVDDLLSLSSLIEELERRVCVK